MQEAGTAGKVQSGQDPELGPCEEPGRERGEGRNQVQLPGGPKAQRKQTAKTGGLLEKFRVGGGVLPAREAV